MLDDRPEAIDLLANIRAALSRLEVLKAECDGHWGAEDGVYRFYHHSFKVYDRLQPVTMSIVAILQQLAPDRPLNPWFLQIVNEGTGKSFSNEHNRRWLAETRPILEAFFHARYFLDAACKYGRELEIPPTLMPSGWAPSCTSMAFGECRKGSGHQYDQCRSLLIRRGANPGVSAPSCGPELLPPRLGFRPVPE